MPFNGFISYSHAADGQLAPAIQRGLHRLAKPWHHRRALWIFRDQTGLAVTPGLWTSIQTALDGSEYFVLLASPEAAQSPWVNREIQHWITTKPTTHILPVLTDGEWNWNNTTNDFTENSTAVPPTLRGTFTEEPFYLDLRWARNTNHLTLHHTRFRDAIAQLAAPMHGISKDDLEGEDVRQHRRTRRLGAGAAVTLLILMLIASLTGISAVRNANRAKNSAAEALAQEKLANGQRDNAARSAQEATHQQELAQQQQALATEASTKAKQSEQTARQAEQSATRQQKLADQATAEAKHQQHLADQAATRTRHQQKLAKEASDRAQKLQKEAKRLAEIAAEQRRAADQAAAEARKQQAKADQQQRIAVSRRLMNQANAGLVDNPQTALMLGAAAQKLNPDTTTSRQLSGVITGTTWIGTLNDTLLAKYGPDGTLATVTKSGQVALWNATEPNRPVQLSVLPGTTASRSLLRFSPDGRTLAIVDAQRRAELWDVARPSHPVRLVTLPTNYAVVTLGFGGTRIVTGDEAGAAMIWNIADRERPILLGTILPYLWIEMHVVVSPDGKFLIADNVPYDITDPANPREANRPVLNDRKAWEFSPDGGVLVVETRTGRALDALHASFFLQCPPDDLRLAGPVHAGFSEPLTSAPLPSAAPTVMPLPSALPTGESLPPVLPVPTRGPGTGNPGDLSQATLLPAPTFSMTATSEPTAPQPTPPRPPNPQPTTPRPTTAQPTPPTSTTPKPTWFPGALSSPPPPFPTEFDIDFDDAFSGVYLPNQVEAVATSSDGRLLAGGDRTGAIQVTDIVAGRDLLFKPLQARGPISSLSFSPDGRTLVSTDSTSTATLWNLTPTGSPEQLVAQLDEDNSLDPAFLSDGHTMLHPRIDGTAWTWNLANPDHPVRGADQTLYHGWVYRTQFTPDNRKVAIVDGNTAKVYLAQTNRPDTATLLPGIVNPKSMVFSPDGRTLAIVTTDGPTLTLWDVADQAHPALLTSLPGITAETTTAFSLDGHTLATGTSSTPTAVTLWNVTNRSAPIQITTVPGHSDEVTSIAFSPDGHHLVIGSKDRTTSLWDVTDLTHPYRLTTLTGNDFSVDSLSFSPNGHTLATTDYLGTTALWDVTNPTSPIQIFIARFKGDRVVFARDGRTFALLNDWAPIALWSYAKLNSIRTDPAKYACAIAGRGLSAAEWARFIPEVKYQRSCPA